MPGLYLDTSALGRILLKEPGHEQTIDAIEDFERRVSSRLLRIELRRLAQRHSALAEADRLLADVALMPLSQSLLESAETVEPNNVATLDAIHLATALRLKEEGTAGTILTYDNVLADGARANGLDVLSP